MHNHGDDRSILNSVVFITVFERRVTGICRKGASDGTQSCQEVVQKAPRTSNPGQ